jgi:hypothetical protein
MKKTLISVAVALALTSLLTACSNSDDPAPVATAAPAASEPAAPTIVGSQSLAPPAVAVPNLAPALPASVPSTTKFFNRTATFTVCSQIGSSCETDVETAAEIVAASEDGMTLVYTNSPRGEIGFVDITNPTTPVALGALAMGGEPTSVTVLGAYALVAVNTSTNFVTTSGQLVVVDIARRAVVTRLALPGQPDSVARSKDGKYVAVVIENQRNEALGNGAPPQLPAGALVVVDVAGSPASWRTRTVNLTGLATLFPTDPEPEYVDINEDNIAVVTLQENNHIVLVDLPTGGIIRHFSAGSVTLERVDLTDAPRPNRVSFSETQANRLREPDGVAWISRTQFVTANEGDLTGGSRGFTVFNIDGTVAYDSGSSMEYLTARIGHYNDKRSDSKGNEPENAAYGRFDGTDYVFIASERSSVVVVYDLSQRNVPAFKQVLPTALGPEGVLTIPSRKLLVVASEVDDRASLVRSSLNIYQYQTAPAAYPTIQSVDRTDGTPIPWSALSGLAAAPTGTLLYGIDDSFFRGNRIFEIDTATRPASLRREIPITDPNGVIAALAATLPDAADANAFDDTDLAAMVNPDGTVNLDPEGIAMATGGGFWIASEGNGTVGETARPVRTANLVFKVSATGVIEEIIALPPEANARQIRFGFEGIAESGGRLVVTFQRAWTGETEPRIGIFDLTSRTWQFVFYPLEAVTSPFGGWVGLSDITPLGSNRFLVVERDNNFGPDARIKRLYSIDLTGVAPGATLTKTLVRDLMTDLRAPRGNVYEKIEGLAIRADGDVFIVNDNDGVDDGANSGETQLINLGRLPN